MHHIHGHLPAGTRIDDDSTLDGSVGGDAYVAGWVTLPSPTAVHGHGNLTIEAGAVVEINGKVEGTVINEGAEVTVKGHVGAISDTGDTKTTVASGATVGA